MNRRESASRLGRIVIVFSLASISACSSDDGTDKPCPARATFDLSLRTATGPLPDDTVLVVKYNSGVEEYRLADAIHDGQKDVLCEPSGEPDDAGDGGGLKAVDLLRCKLWTSGAAKLTVTASGYPDLVKELSAVAKNGCIETVAVDVVLGDTDAGD